MLSGNLVVVDEVPGRIDINLQQYTQAGTLVSSVPIPQPPGQTEYQAGRGVTVDSVGKIDLIDGTSQPYLSTYSPASQTWSHQTFAGWGIGGNISYGMVGSLGRYIYASNQSTAGGIVRFDTAGGATTAFASGKSFEQLTVGQDGLIYGLGYDNLFNQVAYGYDPSTFALVRSVTLPQKSSSTDYYRSIAVNSTGEVFAAAWDDGKIYKFDPTGKTIEAQIQAPGQFGAGENLMSIALDTDGQIAVGGRFGEIYLTNESLASLQTIQTGQWQAFVTFDHYIDVKPASSTTFSSLAAPTITYGTATSSLSGHISDGTSIPPGSVNITLNGVTEAAPIDATTGDFSASFDTSKLGVSSSPYTITYDYPGSGSIPSVDDTSNALTVTPRALTVTANDASKTYGDSDPSFSAGYSGFASGENASVLNGTLGFTTSEPSGNAPVGTYTITAFGLSSPNYTITFSPGTLTVTPRALTVTANDASKTYGDPDPAFSVSYSGLATGDSSSSLGGTLAFTTNEPTGNAPVGNYTITPSGLTSSNYAITFVAGTLNVTAKSLTVTANDASRTYGDPDPAFSASYTGFAPGEDATVLTGSLSFATNEPAGNAPVGTYTITPSGLSSTNYAITFVAGTLNVTARALTVTANDATKVYGDADPPFSVIYAGFAPGDGSSALGGSLSFATNEPAGNAPVGNYTITPSGLTSTNYAITFVAGTLSVTPKSLTVTANDASKTYGDPDPSFTVSYSGFATGEGPGVLTGTLAFATNEPSGNAPVGRYTITPSGLSSPNYTIAFVPGTLSLTPRALTVTANDASKTYGDADPAFGVTYSGFAQGDDSNGLSGTLTFATNEPAGNAPVGAYTITPSGLTSSDYTISFATGTLSVTPRALTVTANDASKTYGDPDPALSASYTGFAPGEDPSVLGGTLSLVTNEPSGSAPVGNYTITPSGLSSSNYTISFVNGTLSVTPRALTVTSNNASKVYGDLDPSFSASYSGFAQGENETVLSGTLSFATNEPAGNAPVGTYTITPSGLTSTNYAITFVPGNLSVTPRALTITADDASKTYGQADPSFTATGSGFATGDSLSSLGGTLTFTTNELDPLTAPAGAYTITPSGLTSPNYSITFQPGTLTVNQAATKFTGITSPTVPIGATSVTLSAKLQSNSVVPTGQSVTVAILGSSGALATGTGVIQSDGTFAAVVNTGSLPMGTYTVQYSYAGDHNFTAASATGSLTVAVDFTVKPLYDMTKTHHIGSTVPIKLEVDNASGQNVSSPDLTVTAVTLMDANGHTFTPQARGRAGNAFRYVNGSYQYNLDSSGLAPGTYTLLVSVGNDPLLKPVTLVIG